MLKKISAVAETIIQDFTDDTELFDQQLKDFVDFKKQHQQRATIFEKRVAEAERGKAKAQGARGEVNKTLSSICRRKTIPAVVKKIIKTIWSHALLLEKLKNNQKGWERRVKIAKLLVWSVQKVDSEERLEKLIAKIPNLVKSLREGGELISIPQMEMSHLLEELETCHHNIINDAKRLIREESHEEIIRLPALKDKTKTTETKVKGDAPKIESEQQNAESEVIVIEDIAFSRIETGELLTKQVKQPAEINDSTRQAAEQLRAGSWVELKMDNTFKRCKLAARIESTGKYIFVNRSGLKMAEFMTDDLCQTIQLGNIKILDDDALFDRALESVISNLRNLKEQA